VSMEQKTIITIILCAVIIAASIYMYLVISNSPTQPITLQKQKNSQLALVGIVLASVLILILGREDEYETDPLKIRERVVNSTFGKQAQMLSLSEITDKYGFDTFINPYNQETFYMWNFVTDPGWADIELYKGKVGKRDFGLLTYRPEKVEITRLDTFRNDVRKAFLTGGVKDAMAVLKREGVLSQATKRRGVLRRNQKENEPSAEDVRRAFADRGGSE
jgi:hypothetical protein